MKKMNIKTHDILFVLLVVLLFNCSSDDDLNIENQLQMWEVQVEQLKIATEEYEDFNVAEQNGLIDVSGYVPNMG